MSSIRNGKKKHIVFKIDFEKAYDWGFGKNRLYLRSSKFWVPFNWIPSVEFKRGLHRGDPLSHFLFILVMESLNTVVSDDMDDYFMVLRLERKGCQFLTYFTLVMLFFLGVGFRKIKNTEWEMWCFYLVSILKINVHKSKLCRVGVTNANLHDLAGFTRCEASFFLFSYLYMRECKVGSWLHTIFIRSSTILREICSL